MRRHGQPLLHPGFDERFRCNVNGVGFQMEGTKRRQGHLNGKGSVLAEAWIGVTQINNNEHMNIHVCTPEFECTHQRKKRIQAKGTSGFAPWGVLFSLCHFQQALCAPPTASLPSNLQLTQGGAPPQENCCLLDVGGFFAIFGGFSWPKLFGRCPKPLVDRLTTFPEGYFL